MPITAKDAFDHGMERASHQLVLYDLLHDTRQRAISDSWLVKFKALMRWPNGEPVVRIDGKEKQSVLFIRQQVGIDRSHFTHDYLSELLRNCNVAMISSIDRYFHDLVVSSCWKLLSSREDQIPKGLKNLRIPLLATKKAIERQKRDSSARPASLVKAEVQELLCRDFTFQSPSNIDNAIQMLGVKNFWGQVGGEMSPRQSGHEVQDRLRKIARRRNQIVHEADLVLKTKAKTLTPRVITRAGIESDLNWVRSFVEAVERSVAS